MLLFIQNPSTYAYISSICDSYNFPIELDRSKRKRKIPSVPNLVKIYSVVWNGETQSAVSYGSRVAVCTPRQKTKNKQKANDVQCSEGAAYLHLSHSTVKTIES
jgi:hypothetical protein